MNYYYSKKLKDCSFNEAIEKTISALQKEGFGVLTEIDIRATLKKKLNADFYNYKILGACNPGLAHKALQVEDKIGTMLPCNVILQEKELGKVEISAVNPEVSMQGVKNSKLAEIAGEVKNKLRRVVESL